MSCPIIGTLTKWRLIRPGDLHHNSNYGQRKSFGWRAPVPPVMSPIFPSSLPIYISGLVFCLLVRNSGNACIERAGDRLYAHRTDDPVFFFSVLEQDQSWYSLNAVTLRNGWTVIHV